MQEKKEKKKWGLILFIVVIMIGTSFSFVFFGFSGVDEKVKYQDITFTKLPDRWEAKINGRLAAFSFLPEETRNIHSDPDSIKGLQNKIEIDVTYDLNSTFAQSIALAQHQMSLSLGTYDIFVRKGFTTNNSFKVPIITCNISTQNVPVVYFRYGNSTTIYSEDACVIAEAPSNSEFIRVKDRILYDILGVLK